MIELIFAGVFDRFPRAQTGRVAEVDCGWVPYVKEQIDNNYQRLDPVSRFPITQSCRASTSNGTSTSAT